MSPAAKSSVVLLAAVATIVAGWLVMRAPSVAHGAPEATVTRGDFVIRLVENATLRAAQALTYRSPLTGREAEITFLAPEGLKVSAGDLLIRLDATSLEDDLARVATTRRQAELQLKMAEAELQTINTGSESAGAEDSFEVKEAEANLQLALQRLEAAQHERDKLQPLYAKGFITAEEFERARLAAAEEQVAIPVARNRVELARRQSRARAVQHLTRHAEAIEKVRALHEQETMLRKAIAATAVYARNTGLVFYEDYLSGGPPRRIRVGDRVTPAQSIITIPDVDQIVADATVREADVHRLAAGMPVAVFPEAYPQVSLPARVTAIGKLARNLPGQVYDDRRFELVVAIDAVDGRLLPGMSARVEVQVARKANTLLVPLNAVFDRDDVQVAYVRDDTGVDVRVVEIGDSNDRYFEVRGGLREGERVLLIDMHQALAPAAAAAR